MLVPSEHRAEACMGCRSNAWQRACAPSQLWVLEDPCASCHLLMKWGARRCAYPWGARPRAQLTPGSDWARAPWARATYPREDQQRVHT